MDDEVTRACKAGSLPEKDQSYFLKLYESYRDALERDRIDPESCKSLFLTILEKIEEHVRAPFLFAPYHRRILSPFNYYELGLSLLRPLIRFESSSLQGKERWQEVYEKTKAGENVIFLANHQIEADPQAIALSLESTYPSLGEEMIFVAGQRVTTDPLAVPFSMGHNLLCVYSKRHIDHPPELKQQKLLHNKKTLEVMRELLAEGGKCIYVAPSGGRDRKDSEGKLLPAPFDPESIELFYLTALRSPKKTSFRPMALSTYSLMPPPETVIKELGETRVVGRDGIHVWIGEEIPMEYFPGSEEPDKKTRRRNRAEWIHAKVTEAYLQFPSSRLS